MNRSTFLKSATLPLAALLLVPVVCLAQGSSEHTYEVITETIKPGMTAKVEQGIKAVDDYAQSHGDPVGSQAFQVVTGPNMGQLFILAAFDWATADQTPSYEAGLQRVVNERVTPYLSNLEFGLTDVLTQLGNPPPAASTPMKYYEIDQLAIKPAHMSAFLTAVASISAAERTENPSTSPVIVYQTRSGGNPNEIIIAFGHPSLADFAKPGMSVLEVLQKARGDDAATVITRSLADSIASEQTYIVEFRPDLSYVPSGQGH
jgi:hypothetical protein